MSDGIDLRIRYERAFLVRKLALAAAATSVLFSGVLCTGAASAADMGAPAPAYTKAPAPVAAQIYDWTGFYVGGNFGGGWQDASFASTSTSCFVLNCGDGLGHVGNDPAIQLAGTGSDTRAGFAGGGQIGFNWQVNALVLGAEADIEAISGKLSIGGGPFPLASNLASTFTLTTTADATWVATVRGRVGFAADKWLLYATGGAAFTNLKLAQSYTDNCCSSTPLTTFTASTTKTGYAVGGGVEYAISRIWSLRAEYLFAGGFGSLSGSYLATANSGNSDFHTVSAKLNIQQARVGLNYLFGGPVVAKY